MTSPHFTRGNLIKGEDAPSFEALRETIGVKFSLVSQAKSSPLSASRVNLCDICEILHED